MGLFEWVYIKIACHKNGIFNPRTKRIYQSKKMYFNTSSVTRLTSARFDPCIGFLNWLLEITMMYYGPFVLRNIVIFFNITYAENTHYLY